MPDGQIGDRSIINQDEKVFSGAKSTAERLELATVELTGISA
jgi:hypothetical protein